MFWGRAVSMSSLSSVPSSIFLQCSHPRAVMKYTLRRLFPLPLMCPLRHIRRPSSTSLPTMIETWDLEIPTASAMPYWVISGGIMNSVVSTMWR